MDPAVRVKLELSVAEVLALADLHDALDASLIERVVGKPRRGTVANAIAKLDNARRACRGRKAA